MRNLNNETSSKVDFIINNLLESVKYLKSPFFIRDKVSVSSETISIRNFSIKIDNYNKIYLIIMGKGILGLVNFFISKLNFERKFNLIVLIPSQLARNVNYGDHKISIYPGNHPIPNKESFESTLKIIDTIKSLQKDDLIICFIGGGSSSLFSYPNPELTKNEFLEIWKQLLYSNLTINEINKFRGIIDLVKKGGFNTFTDAQIISFSVSDVVGDNLSSIGSGPTIAEEAESMIFPNWNKSVKLSPELEKKLVKLSKKRKQIKKVVHSSLLISQTDFARTLVNIIISKSEKSELHMPAFSGYFKLICQRIINFFTEKNFSGQKREQIYHIWTGESVVEIPSARKMGMGGRNQHLLLYLFKLWKKSKLPKALLVTFSTDGIDGSSPYAGGWVYTEDTNMNLTKLESYLESFDSSSFLKSKNIIKTGNTGINFADIILVYIL